MKIFTVGWKEWVSLPLLDIPSLKVKTDTGARTSSLHAFNIQPYGSKSKPMVRFGVHPIPERPDIFINCSAPVIDKRDVTSSNGNTELRYVIRTLITAGERKWEIDLTLANRENMAYRMLLGRTALEGLIVKPDHSFLQPKLSFDVYLKKNMKSQRPLRIAILKGEADNYSTKRLIETADRRGHSVDLIDTKKCYLNLQSQKPEVHYDGNPLPFYDAVIPRIGPSLTIY